jgi:acetate kinase
MNTLVLNPGSTSLKSQLFSGDGTVIDSQRFGAGDLDAKKQYMSHLTDLKSVIVRVVHGGDLSGPHLVTQEVKQTIEDYKIFAPIHNTKSLRLIEMVQELFPELPVYACFDTSFHTSIEEKHFTYAVPERLKTKYHIRKYGFHGLAIQSALSLLEQQTLLPKKLIVIHLGGGCSVTAVQDGASVCTSMGLTPLSGIMMTQRCGDLDPSIYPILQDHGMETGKITDILEYESGFIGLTDSSDIKTIIEKAQEGNQKEKLAFDIFVSNIVQRVFAYTGVMQGCDAVVFTGGIGYGNEYLRSVVLKQLDMLGINKSNSYHLDVDETKLMFDLVEEYIKKTS